MKVVILYRPNSEQEKPVREFAMNWQARRPDAQPIEYIDIDSRDGSDKAQIYGITSYPAVMAATDDGRVLHIWQGGIMPLVNELEGYLQ